MVFELFYSAEELTKFRDDAVFEESAGLLESVSSSAEPTFKVEELPAPTELLFSPPGRKGRITLGRQSLLLQVAESPIALREVLVESAVNIINADDDEESTTTSNTAARERRPRVPREQRNTGASALPGSRSRSGGIPARRTDRPARSQSSLVGPPLGRRPVERTRGGPRHPHSTSPVRPKRQEDDSTRPGSTTETFRASI
jgi:hypothetical protein